MKDDVALDILNSCRRLVNLVHTSAKVTEKNLGISVAQLFVLKTLAEGRAFSINELSEETKTHQSSVSVVVKKLLARELVQSQPSEKDGRRQEIKISRKGRALLAKAEGTHIQDQLMQASLRLPLDERRELDRLLKRLIQEMEGRDEPPALFFEG